MPDQEFAPLRFDAMPFDEVRLDDATFEAPPVPTPVGTPPARPGVAEDLLTASDLRQLLDIVSQLNAVGDPQALLTSIIETAADLLECDAASLLLYNEATDRLRFEAATGSDAATLAEIPVPLFGSIAGAIFREGRVINTARAQDDERHYDGVGKKVNFQTQSLLGVPMHIEGQVVGVLEALNKRAGDDGPRDFDRRDEHLLALLADQTAVTIRNVRQRTALRDAYDRLAQIEAMKSNFVTLTSHELRTPIATIRGFAELLRDDAADDMTRDHAAVIVESAQRMGQVVDVMGELNELRLGRTLPAMRYVRASRVLRKASTRIEPHAATKQQTVTLVSPDDDLHVYADPDKLERALQHLVTNAVTFTPDEGTLTLRAAAKDGGVLFQVTDTGCGLAEEHLEAVFREYYQVQQALTRSHGGLGLGLTVARGIAEVHGGRVWAESGGLGHGATFSLWLPTSSTSATNPAIA
ncbi:MAG: GAF domain-containing sensor histidine kinase [Bacteroidota bacterium]